MQPRPGRTLRPVRILPADVAVERRPDGTTYVRPRNALGPYPDAITSRLEHWADVAPDRTFLAERGGDGEWRRLAYGDALLRTRALAQALVDRRLTPERPMAIVSGNGIDHACLALAAMYAGVPYTPISPAYSLLAKEYDALRHIFSLLRPGLVFADDGAAFEPALRSVLDGEAELVVSSRRPSSLASTPLAELDAVTPSPALEAAHAAVGPDTVAKILFTSGSTGRPKGVINTQRMLCANQQTILTALAFLADEPPVLCDWLPWNHTFGGNHNFGIALYNGGTLYIDAGLPTSQGFATTARNLREIATTAYFNVPKGYEMLVAWLRRDRALRERFFSRLQLLFFAGAGLSQRVWDELQDLAVETRGEEVLMITGLGASEMAPAGLFTGLRGAQAGWIGLPLPGFELKLAPVGEMSEARVRGPSVTPGYFRNDELTRAAYDEEGYYRMGDAVRWVDAADPEQGLFFEGRLNENFKLSSGTWVAVGSLRARLLAQLGALAHDAVVVGPDRDFVGTLVFPNMEACAALCGARPGTPARAVLDHPLVRQEFAARLTALRGANPGTSTHVERALLLDVPPSLDSRELTDKGSVNQRAVMQTRAAAVEELYAAAPSERVLAIGAPAEVRPRRPQRGRQTARVALAARRSKTVPRRANADEHRPAGRDRQSRPPRAHGRADRGGRRRG